MRPYMSEEAIEKDRKKLEEIHEKQLEDFPDSRLVIAEGSTHLVQLEKPEVIVMELKKMIQNKTRVL